MSMVQSAMLLAPARANGWKRTDSELSRYVATECRGRHAHWLASILKDVRESKPTEVRSVKREIAPEREAQARPTRCCPVMKALSESCACKGEAVADQR